MAYRTVQLTGQNGEMVQVRLLAIIADGLQAAGLLQTHKDDVGVDAMDHDLELISSPIPTWTPEAVNDVLLAMKYADATIL